MSFQSEEDPETPIQQSFEPLEDESKSVTKISNFLDMKNISIGQFWQSNRNYISLQDLQQFCDNCGLKLSIHDQINLKSQIFSKREVVSIYDFCDLIPQWRSNGNQLISQFLRERSQQLVQNLNHKLKNQRIKSASGILSRPLSVNPSSESHKKKDMSHSKDHGKTLKTNNSYKYLYQNKLKNLQKEHQLAETIQKAKNQHEYDMLKKMNELNEHHHKNKSRTTYRAYKNAEGIIKVRLFELENFKKQLSLQQFESEYKIYKKSTKENRNWQRPSTSKLKQNSKEFIVKTLETATVSKNKRKQQRQQELKNLLTNTINLTRLLEQQIKIFKMKGIHGSDKI